MTIASPLPFLVSIAAYLLVGAAIGRFSRFYYTETHSPENNRFEALDGLRGLLAFGVYFHHARFTYQFYSNGCWEAPEGGIYLVLGPLSVALFFSLTAFLFWRKALAKGGRVDPVQLFMNRVRRIAPMYYVSLAVAGAVVLVLAKFQFSPFATLAPKIGRMLFMGFFGFPEDSIDGTPVNMINAGVFWTLRYEWSYYFSLPLLAITLRRPKIFVLFVIVFAAASALRPSIQIARLGPFVLGMCAAQLISWQGHSALLRSRFVALIAVLSLLLVPLTMGNYGAESRQSAWKPVTTFCIALPFIAAVYGNDFFGLLKLRGAKVLGLISYSVYLLHGILLFVVMRIVHLAFPINRLSPIMYWVLAFFCGLLTLVLSAVTYRFVEYPWLKYRARRPAPIAAELRSSMQPPAPVA